MSKILDMLSFFRNVSSKIDEITIAYYHLEPVPGLGVNECHELEHITINKNDPMFPKALELCKQLTELHKESNEKEQYLKLKEKYGD